MTAQSQGCGRITRDSENAEFSWPPPLCGSPTIQSIAMGTARVGTFRKVRVKTGFQNGASRARDVYCRNSGARCGAKLSPPTDRKLSPLRHGRDDTAHLKYALLHVLERVLCKNTNLVQPCVWPQDCSDPEHSHAENTCSCLSYFGRRARAASWSAQLNPAITCLIGMARTL